MMEWNCLETTTQGRSWRVSKAVRMETRIYHVRNQLDSCCKHHDHTSFGSSSKDRWHVGFAMCNRCQAERAGGRN